MNPYEKWSFKEKGNPQPQHQKKYNGPSFGQPRVPQGAPMNQGDVDEDKDSQDISDFVYP